MKQAILFSAFTTVTLMGFARTFPASNMENSPRIAHAVALSARTPAVGEILSEIISVAGLQPEFELKSAKVLNIEAIVLHGKKLIRYNPGFLGRINQLTDNKWAVYTLLAHEVGHHVLGHTARKTGSRPELELAADEFAGSVLYKLGATLEQSQEVMIYIARTEASETHPDRASRMMAIERGWNRAGNP